LPFVIVVLNLFFIFHSLFSLQKHQFTNNFVHSIFIHFCFVTSSKKTQRTPKNSLFSHNPLQKGARRTVPGRRLPHGHENVLDQVGGYFRKYKLNKKIRFKIIFNG
jgi:hypothetical protein